MGLEAACSLRLGKRHSTGKLLFETDALVFRGDFRLAIPLTAIQQVSASRGTMTVQFKGGPASFELGPLADTWAARIGSPKTRLQKLGLKKDARVSIVDLEDPVFRSELRSVTPYVHQGRRQRQNDAVFLGANSSQDLVALKTLRSILKPDGALWVIRPKGHPEITEASVMAAGKAAGLVDVKVVRFSDTHTAEKFVIPLKMRPKAGQRRSPARAGTT